MALSEFSLIDRYFKPLGVARDTLRGVELGIGDDCALLSLPPGQQLAVSIDTLVEGSHFLPQITATQLADRAFAACVSDLAAMGAEPRWLTLALTLADINEPWLAEFSDALARQLRAFDMLLVGGDTTKGPVLTLSLQVHGWVPEGQALRRDGARPGDYVFVTGTLGDAMAGLEHLQHHHDPDPYLLSRFFHPTPRISTGIALRPHASAAADISDGLLADIGHIIECSSTPEQPLGVVIQPQHLPLSEELRRHFSAKQAQQWALAGGEDFELCFTVPESQLEALQQTLTRHPIPCTQVGRVVAEAGCWLEQANGQRQRTDNLGFKHF